MLIGLGRRYRRQIKNKFSAPDSSVSIYSFDDRSVNFLVGGGGCSSQVKWKRPSFSSCPVRYPLGAPTEPPPLMRFNFFLLKILCKKKESKRTKASSKKENNTEWLIIDSTSWPRGGYPWVTTRGFVSEALYNVKLPFFLSSHWTNGNFIPQIKTGGDYYYPLGRLGILVKQKKKRGEIRLRAL